ncbi:VapE domain-containing protein [Streptococcus sp. ZJ93]|uniref:VapE domain-containing protein n=1 Tax=Streptococcus handemini TaxID=3161188 RepID=UPI0034D732D5
MDRQEIVDSIIKQDEAPKKEPKPTHQELAPAFRTYGKTQLPTRSPYNVVLVFEQHQSIFKGVRYNDFSKTIEKTKPTPWGTGKGFWSEEDTKLSIAFIDEKYGFAPTRENVEIAILKIAKGNTYHPVKDRIESQKWDGVQRAERYFIDLLGCPDTSYVREVTRLWLTGLIARIYQPGIKFEIVPILTGGQGLGKSTATKRLLPEFHSDSVRKFGDHAEDYRILQTNAIIEFGELKGFKKTAIEAVKNFISASSDDIRALYSRKPEKNDRHCVFIGTSNAKGFLKDEGKERRFYPIQCGVNDVACHPMEKEEGYFLQVLAEAKKWYDEGQPLTISSALDAELEQIQEAYKVEDPEKEAILEYLGYFYPPVDWYELSPHERRQYFLKHLREPLDDNQSYKDFPLAFGKIGIEITTPNEVAYIVFNENPTKGRGGHYSQKARDVLDNHRDWERSEIKKRLWKKGTPTPYYFRKRL